MNLHHAWDSAIPEKMLGHRGPYPAAKQWAGNLSVEIRSGKYSSASQSWADGLNLDDPIKTAMLWASESNAHVCTAGTASRLLSGSRIRADICRNSATGGKGDRWPRALG